VRVQAEVEEERHHSPLPLLLHTVDEISLRGMTATKIHWNLIKYS
jgi:hypothetical protein